MSAVEADIEHPDQVTHPANGQPREEDQEQTKKADRVQDAAENEQQNPDPVRAHLITSIPPMSGFRTSGITMLPSACW